jgi:hypothetical protein
VVELAWDMINCPGFVLAVYNIQILISLSEIRECIGKAFHFTFELTVVYEN